MAHTPAPQHSAEQTSGTRASAPGRRSVLRAAAWSVPAVSVATAAPAFATSGPGSTLAHTASLFWRPTTAEANSFGEGLYWSFIPETTILFIVTLTNAGAPMTSSVEIAVDVPVDASAKKEFQILDAGGLATTPAVNALTQRPASGRVVIAVPPLTTSETKAITTAISAPTSLSRSTATSWNVTVLPGSGTARAVPVTSYTQFRNGV